MAGESPEEALGLILADTETDLSEESSESDSNDDDNELDIEMTCSGDCLHISYPMATVMPPKQHGTYTFASQPRAIQQRDKYRRDPLEAPTDDSPLYGNIMYDRRVIRGNTYAQTTLPAHAQSDPIELERQQENRRRAIARKRAHDQLKARSPQPVEGRRHVDVQTELYLEELSDRVEEADVDVQTDAFLDRPATPLFVPAKTGLDVETQIYKDDLFDFDVEVRPILEVLVGKTVEQSLLEVMEEEELANLRGQQREFEELRNAELVEQQRLEEQERRHREEKVRRMKQQKLVLEKERESAEKIAARAFAQSYMSDLVPSVFGTLADHGYFYDPVERDIEQGFVPWLMEDVVERLHKQRVSRTVVDAIIRDVVAMREEEHTRCQASILTLSKHSASEARASQDNVTGGSGVVLKASQDGDVDEGSSEQISESVVQQQQTPEEDDDTPAAEPSTPAEEQ